jgi:murein L,D-transpeptidase YafK
MNPPALHTTLRLLALTLAAALALPAAAWDDFLLRDEGLSVHIYKYERLMELRDDGRLVRRFDIRLGGDPFRPKRVRGDERTPVGRYYIRAKNTRTGYHRFLGINYPSIADADRGLDNGLISEEEWADIFFANVEGSMPPQNTRLGGRIGIHGYGGRPVIPYDWTEGCIAVTDAEIEYLFSQVEVGTPVLIYD